MKQYTFESVRNDGLLIYEYIRGSHAYGLQKPDGSSDVDTAGVYIEPIEQVLGMGLDFQEQISDEKGDNVWYGLKKFFNLLLTSNPTVLESLFIPKDKILYEHPIMTEIKKHREKFVTKECFKAFIGYAKTQILKARGLNKKIVNPVNERLEPLDFAYTFYNQGSTKVKNWLEYRGLDQKYCGLVRIPNMREVYGVYYDWGNHFEGNGMTIFDLEEEYFQAKKSFLQNDPYDSKIYNLCNFLMEYTNKESPIGALSSLDMKPIGYKGMVGDDGMSNELRLSSVSKGVKPICYISYNKDGYTKHCKDYKEYKDWEKYRNPERYRENITNNKGYDAKNMAHSVRLLHMGIEIAKTGVINIDRTNIDRDFIMNVRLGKMSYDELINYLDSKKEEMDKAIEESTIPDKIDTDFVNNILLNIRKKQLEAWKK